MIELIKETSPYLIKVKDLWRKYSKTLGFFPDGAFEEHAAKGGVLIARSERGDLYGYLLYRIVHRGGVWPIGVIVHLCIDEPYRGRSIAKGLVDKLRSLPRKNFLRIEVNCRRDYEANDFWPKVGFVYNGEFVGRSGHPISRWQLELNQLPLMALLEKTAAPKTRAVIDMNILYRLQDPLPEIFDRDRILSEEAKAIKEDWIAEEVTLLITPEAFNEIHKIEDPAKRISRHRYAKGQFDRIIAKLDEVRTLKQRLSIYFPENPNESLKSDISHIAYSIKSEADFFLTQDIDLEKKGEEIYKEFGIRILPPGKFIGRLDEITREVEYRPSRLGGSHALTIGKARIESISRLYPIYQWGNPEARKTDFESKLRNFLAQPNRYSVEIFNIVSKPSAFIVIDRNNSSELGVPIIRVSRSPLSGTVMRYLLRRVIQLSAKENRPFIRVTDIQTRDSLTLALEECGFTSIENQWIKFGLQVADNAIGLQNRLGDLIRRDHPSTNTTLLNNLTIELCDAVEKQDSIRLADLERRLWPAKILDASIPTFIVSIMPVWAQHLFDEGIASQTLWGGRDDLLLLNENVYYRSARPSGGLLSPARVLWYISEDKDTPTSTKQIRACSSLIEVVIGRATDLFHRFERLGIYEWKDVLTKAKNQPTNQVMALRFNNTQLLPHPIDLPTLRRFLREDEDKKPMLESPQRILPRTFARIYQAAFNDGVSL